MKTLKIVVVLLFVAVSAWLTWNYFAGPIKVRRDMHEFASSLVHCETFSKALKTAIRGVTLQHSIDGEQDGRCRVRMQTLGPHVVSCAFPVEQLPVIAEGFRDSADALDMFGGMEIRISTSDPDPLTRALNSDSCTTSLE